MTARKTIPVEALRNRVNEMLANSQPDRSQGREALASLLESVLMDTDNYKGFRYLGLSDHGAFDPIDWSNVDETRREYL